MNLSGKRKLTESRSSGGKWMELAFCKRECNHYVASAKDVARCSCGQTWTYHKTRGIEGATGPRRTDDEVWNPSRHTVTTPTDAFGTIDFLGGPHPNKAQFIRLDFNSRSDLIMQLLTREWGIEMPKLVISVHGGKANFDLNSRLKRLIGKGLLRTAKTTGAWILTGGTNTGVTRHVGDALISERSPRLRGGRVVSIGIAPWGVVENRASLIGYKKDVTYLSIDQPRSKFAVLNNRHAYFLLVDNGTVGRYGAEIALRRKFEKYISSQRLPARTHCSIPVVCVVIEGGMHTIRTVLEYVTDSPPVPVVVCEGSGRAADLLAFAHKYAPDDDQSSSSVLDGMKEQLVATIQRTFNVDVLQADKLYSELLQCVRKKNLITIFRPSAHDNLHSDDPDDTVDGHDLDAAILSALFRSRHLSATEKLCLTLAWNRVDIARSEIFVYGQEWQEGALDEAMMEALVNNRIDFVKLLLETGVQMAKFLTIPRLEELYNSKLGPANTLRYIVRDVRPHMSDNYYYTLLDIGLVINKLMSGAYRSYYTRRKFRHIYYLLMKKPVNNSSTFGRVYTNHVTRNPGSGVNNGGVNTSTLNGGLNVGLNHSVAAEESQHGSELSGTIFAQPFNELLIWSVLTKRQDMAKLMWQHGEEALAKALVASQLYRALASEAADDDMDVDIFDELRGYAEEFDQEALEMFDYCYRQDDVLAQQLLTCELTNWSRQTCLRLAVACNHRMLLAHPCSQQILGDLWMGGLRTRRNTYIKVIAGLIFPPMILRLEFKSKQELQLMPQTEEEHLIDLKDERSDTDETNSSASSSSSSSSLSFSSESASPRSERSASHGAATVAVNLRLTNLQSVQESAVKDSQHPQNSVNRDAEMFNTSNEEGRSQTGQLGMKKKFYEFYGAPITKFCSHSIAYCIFLIIYTYTMLVQLPTVPCWNEYFILAHIATFGGEKIREILASEPVKLSHKLSVWAASPWNLCDAAAVIEFHIAFGLRFYRRHFDVGRVLLCLNIVFWYIRILRFLSVSKFLGPFVTMMGKMLKKMMYYIVLMMVVLLSYGVFRQSLLFPNEEWSWFLVRDVLFQPYFMIYGELFAGEIDPKCGDEGGDQPVCVPGRWLNPLLMTCYLLVANILLLNLLIAVFNAIFMYAHTFSHEIWKFNRFGVVMEYEQKPALPPPLIIFSHIFLIIKWCRRRTRGMKDSYDYGLKLFLDTDDLERLYDFEEESMEGLARERELKANMSTDERVRFISQGIDAISHKVEDTLQKSSYQNQKLQALDFRLLRVEDIAEQLNSNLSLIQHLVLSQSNTNDRYKNDVLCDITAEEFRQQLDSKRPSRVRTGSGCAFDDGDEGPPLQVHPKDLVLLESIGPVAGRHQKKKKKKTAMARRRTSSETSLDESKIQATIEKAERELAIVSAGMAILHSPEEMPDRPFIPAITLQGASQPYVSGDHDDDDIIDEMFECELQEIDDTVESSIQLRDMSPAYRSNSVGGNTELRKRNRNWSGTATSLCAVSPSSCQRLKNLGLSPVVSKTAISSDEESSQPSEQLNERAMHLQAVHGWPNASCNACQRIRSSLSLVSHTPQPSGGAAGTGATAAAPATGLDAPKLSLIPTASMGYVTAMDNFPPLTMKQSTGARANPANVEAEAEHLRQMEGQDYRRMEGIIRRRLHRDSENLDISLEDLCYAPIKDDTLDSLESPDMEVDPIRFMRDSSSFTSEDEEEDLAPPPHPAGKSQLKTVAPTSEVNQTEVYRRKSDVKITVEAEE